VLFFDPKEEVLDIELTLHGKRLLQHGEFKPAAYAFFDDDIIYDTRYVSSNASEEPYRMLEHQNESETRIQDETPRLKIQHVFYSPEGYIRAADPTHLSVEKKFQANRIGPHIVADDINIVGSVVEMDRFSLNGPLGNSSAGAKHYPAWQVKFYEAPMTGSVVDMSGSLGQRVPQINCDLNYKINIEQGIPQEDEERLGTTLEDANASSMLLDGTYFIVEEDTLFISVEETNTDFINENFDFEVFRVPDPLRVNATKTSDLIKLYFSNESETEAGNSSYVEYFFDVLVDDEIPEEKYCQAVKNERLVATYKDRFLFDCENLPQDLGNASIYNIPSSEEGICE